MIVDLVIFTVCEGRLKALLVKRAEEPFAGYWSIPGGFLNADESLDDAAVRVRHEKTGVNEVFLEQLYTFGDPDRNPRARAITVTYFALIPWKNLMQPATAKVADVAWFPVDGLPALAFDQLQIVNQSIARLRARQV